MKCLEVREGENHPVDLPQCLLVPLPTLVPISLRMPHGRCTLKEEKKEQPGLTSIQSHPGCTHPGGWGQDGCFSLSMESLPSGHNRVVNCRLSQEGLLERTGTWRRPVFKCGPSGGGGSGLGFYASLQLYL